MYKLISIITLIMVGFSLSIQAETISNAGTIVIKQKDIPSNKGSRPHAPVRIPLVCELEGNQIVITSDYPTLVIAEVTTTNDAEIVADYISAESSTVHQFSIEPQGTTLTIEIQLNDKTYTGEFFY